MHVLLEQFLLLPEFRHGHRPSTYGPEDYFGEFGQLVAALQADGNVANGNNLIGPNLATGDWTPECM